jgi:protein O-mannosyl-transferase
MPWPSLRHAGNNQYGCRATIAPPLHDEPGFLDRMTAVETRREEASWKLLAGICLFLALITLGAYWPVMRNEFVNYDDTDYVTANPNVQAGLSAKGLAWVWRSEVARNWHPLTMLSHMLDCQLYGMKPWGHHLTSLLLHVANTVLLFLLLWQMTGAVWRCGFVAGLFALHPLHVESVAWVAERKDVLSTFFFLLTLGAYVRYSEICGAVGEGRRLKSEVRSPKSEGKGDCQSPIANCELVYYWAAVGLFTLGLMSKPMLVTVPFVLLLLDYWPLGRFDLSTKPSKLKTLVSLLSEKVPFLLLSAISCVVTFRVQQSGGAVLDVLNLPLGARVANALVSYARYVGKMVWPEGLAGLYLRKTPWPGWAVVLAAVAVVGVSVTVLRLARRRQYLAVGWFWYLGTLVPVIGLVQVGMQTMADRYTYIPLIGVFIMIAWGGGEGAIADCRLPIANWRWTMAVLVLGVCMVLTRQQLAWWRDSETLFQRMITAVEGNYMAHYNLGNLYSRQDNLVEAVRHYEAALSAEPNYAEAHNNLGGVLLRLRRFDEAVAHYSAAVRVKPEFLYYFNLGNALVDAGKPAEAVANYQQALRYDPNSSQAHHNLGLALQAQGKAEEAMPEFRAALRLQPDYESAEHHLANRLADAGRLEEAMAHYAAALRLDPKHAESYNGLGICYAMQGKLAEAERQFQEAVRLKPDYAGAHSNLGNALGAQNKLEEAIPHYQKALEIDPKDYQTQFNLGVSLLRQGRTPEAKARFQEALRLRPDYAEAQKALAGLNSGVEQKH